MAAAARWRYVLHFEPDDGPAETARPLQGVRPDRVVEGSERQLAVAAAVLSIR